MKTGFTNWIIIFPAVLIVVLLFSTCKKTEDTTSNVPTVSTNTASLVGQKWATLKGTVNANNQICEVSFEYDTTASFKHYINAIPDTVNGNTSTTISALLTGLTANTTYYFRTKVISSSYTTYGTEETFKTTNPGRSLISYNPDLTYGFVMDIDGNIYKTILIGTQTWMAENLKTTSYNDGTVIPFVPGESAWTDLSTPGYCWYNNDSVSYGAIYNWYAAGNNNLCPTGWHVPSDAEWTTLSTFLGGESIAGDKLKETGTTHWLTSNNNSSNQTGFTALPGGYRSYSASYGNIKRYGYWWSSTEASSTDAFCRYIFYSFDNLGRNTSSKNSGFSIRCIKN